MREIATRQSEFAEIFLKRGVVPEREGDGLVFRQAIREFNVGRKRVGEEAVGRMACPVRSCTALDKWARSVCSLDATQPAKPAATATARAVAKS